MRFSNWTNISRMGISLLIIISLFGCNDLSSNEYFLPTQTSIYTANIFKKATITLNPTHYPLTACVNISSLNVRSGPGIDYQIIKYLYKGDCINLISRNKDGSWVKFLYGWVSSYYLKIQGNISSLPFDNVYSHTIVPSKILLPKPTITFKATYKPTTKPKNNIPQDKVCSCSYNKYNCSDFPTQKAAQACFEHCMNKIGYDVHWLDDDKDGKACEWNP